MNQHRCIRLGAVVLAAGLLTAPLAANAATSIHSALAVTSIPAATAHHAAPVVTTHTIRSTRPAKRAPIHSSTKRAAAGAVPARPIAAGVAESVKSLASVVVAASAIALASASSAATPTTSPSAPPVAVAPVAAPAAAPVTAAAAPVAAAAAPVIAAVAPVTTTVAPVTSAVGPVAPVITAPVTSVVAAPPAALPVAPVVAPVIAPVLSAASVLTTAGTAADSAISLGPLTSVIAQGAVVVPVGSLTQSLIDSSPSTTTFVLATGTHRLTSALRPKAGQSFLGLPGAIVSGSAVLTGWAQTGNTWTVTGQDQRLPRLSVSGYSICESSAPLCNNAEEVFMDGSRLKPVSSASALVAGTFFFDYANSTITLADNPATHVIETSVAPQAFINASGNVFRNLVVQEFGNTAQSGAISGINLTLDHDTIQLNHGGGISQYNGTITHTRILRNGQLGVGGGGANLLVDTDEIAYNNADGYDPNWEAGGSKWAFSSGLVVRGTWAHDNDGPGLATDVDNTNTTYENNVVENNTYMGISHEISGNALIANNIIRNNGTGGSWWVTRVGIDVIDSHDVEVVGNLVIDNGGGGILGTQDERAGGNGAGSWELRNLDVHNNLVQVNKVPTAYVPVGNGLQVNSDDNNRAQYFSSAFNNVFADNNYLLPAAGSTLGYFMALNSGPLVSFSAWQATGEDAGSTWTAAG